MRIKTKLLDKLTLDSKVNYIRRNIDNQLYTGEGYGNPVRALYKLPTNIPTADAMKFEFTDPNGVMKQHYWQPGNNAPFNPYWNINRLKNNSLNERVIGFMSLAYQFTDELSLIGRASLDRFNSAWEERWANDSYIIADGGKYSTTDSRGNEFNTDFLLNYNKNVTTDISVNASVGGNVRRYDYRRISVNDDRRSTLNVPNLYSFGNQSFHIGTESFQQKAIHSMYAFATIGWKNAVFLDITGRNDWSSALTAENRSFFYPSLGLTVVASDLMSSVPSWLTLLKVRASNAKVGNDTDPYQTSRLARIAGGGTGGFLQLSTTIPNENLLPESTVSTEIGLDTRLFENRLGLDFTYYKSNSTDQLFAIFVPIASGASNVFLNGADIQNSGFEAILTGTPVRTSAFNWDITLNFAKNNSLVSDIAEGFDQLNIGGADFMRQFRLIKGRPWGDVYSRGFARDDQGRVIVEANGTPRTTPGLDVQVANFNPDFLAGVRNSLSFGDVSMSFLIDIRQGGSVVSFTNAIMYADGIVEETLNGRDGGLVFGQNFFADEEAVGVDTNGDPTGSANTATATSEAMWSKLGGRNAPVGEAFVLDASNIRMREMTLGYSVPKSMLSNSPLSTIKVSLVGRNLFFITNKAGNVDPEIIGNTATNIDGLESFGPPTTREIGINLKFGF